MRPSEDVKRDFVRVWLRKADGDLKAGHHLLAGEEGHAESAAFHAHQAVEKYLKAFLVWHQIEFPKTHDIARLLQLVDSRDTELAVQAARASDLTAYGVDYRYPGDYPDVSLAQAERCVEIANGVRDAVLERLPPDVLP